LQANAQRVEALDRSPSTLPWPLEGATIDAYRPTTWALKWIGSATRGNDGATLEPYPFRRDPWKSAFWRDEFRRRYAE